jgi:3-hydroxyisobutyrate dehydrogenase
MNSNPEFKLLRGDPMMGIQGGHLPVKQLSVGFVGLGVMGTPMVSHLHAAGHRLTLHDLDHDLAKQLSISLGGETLAVGTPREVAERSDVVITMLPNGGVVQAVVLGEHGLAAGFKPGALLLDTSSSEPWITQETARHLAGRGVAMVDAPVSGAQWGAQKAELVFMVGGAAADLERVRPLLDGMGRAVFHLGPLGAGHAMKCINNLVTAMTLSATAEGLVIGKAYGLDPAAMVEVMNVSTAM